MTTESVHTNPDGTQVTVTLGDYVTLGNDVTFGNFVRLGNYVKLGSDVRLGNGVTLASARDVIECRAGSGPHPWLAYRDASEWSFTAGCFGPVPLFVDPNMNPDDQPPHVVAEREAALTYLRAMAEARTSGIA